MCTYVLQIKEMLFTRYDTRIYLDCQKTTCIRIENKLCGYAKNEKGVRQGCAFSLDSFNLSSETILGELETLSGIIIGWRKNNIRYSDDIARMADSEMKLRCLLDMVLDESELKSLSMNREKAESIVIGIEKKSPECVLRIGDTNIEEVQKILVGYL